MEHNSGNNIESLGVDEDLVPERSRREHGRVAREVPVINVGNRLEVEVERGEYRHNREHSHSVGDETPPNALPCGIDWIEQCAHTLKEQNDNDS